MSAPEPQKIEIPRDRYGRPMVCPPNSKKRVAYRRVTTFVGCLDDQSGLTKWKQRHVAYGMGQRKDLVVAAAAADPGDKKKLGDIADEAFEFSNGTTGNAATIGTALHSLTERVDRGQQLGVVPAEFKPDIEEYQRATEGIEWIGIEAFRVHDEWKVAGTADRLGRFPWSDRIRICDIKTGSIDYPHKMAMQLAMYARSLPYDIATDKRGTDPGEIDLNTGVIIHLPAGQGTCALYEINISAGWGACLIAHQVWRWRGTKDLTRELQPPSKPPTWESLIAAATSLDDLRLIWSRAKELGELNANLKAAATAKSKELAA